MDPLIESGLPVQRNGATSIIGALNIFDPTDVGSAYGFVVPPDGDNDSVENALDSCPAIANPSQSDIDLDGLGDLCDDCPADFVNECIPGGSAAEEVTVSEGGTIETPNGELTLDIDPDDLGQDTTISVTEEDTTDPNVDLSIGGTPASGEALAVYDLKPDGLVFDNPILVTFSVDVTGLNGTQRANLDVYRLNDATQEFEPLGAICTVAENPIGTFIADCSVEISSFSIYAIVGPLDSDNDGVPDVFNGVIDVCPTTPMGELVGTIGCPIAIDLMCPCDNAWKNHGKYVRCIAATTTDIFADGLITDLEKDGIVSAAAESSCGN